jgi:acetoin utilization protein AcuC
LAEEHHQVETHPRAILVEHTGFEHLTYPPSHPFRPERAAMLYDILAQQQILGASWLTLVPPALATRAELEAFHHSAYLDALEHAGQGQMDERIFYHGIGTPDCPSFPGVEELAAVAAGSTLAAARALADGQAHFAMNPMGGFHHAGAEHAEGFCYVNDVVLACLELAARGMKVACVDLDAHHGNGTQEALYARADILKVSLHESGATLYPWGGFETEQGEGAALGHNVNFPLPFGADDVAFLRAVREVVVPVVRAFSPDVIVLELGMDVLAGDPLVHLSLTNNGPAEAAERIAGLGIPTLVLGGGGYNSRNTARGWALAFMAMTGTAPDDAYVASLGGVFLGSSEHNAGLRDMRQYASGADRERIDAEVDRVIAFHRKQTFPILGL